MSANTEPKSEPKFDVVGAIIEYESGDLSDEGKLKLFSELVKNGTAWSLQGHYGRTASALINAGYLSDTGEILRDVDEAC